MVAHRYGLFGASLVLALLLWQPATSLENTKNEAEPLFSAFKTFCLDTRGQFNAVAKVVKASPYKFRERASIAFGIRREKTQTKAWDFVVAGYRMSLDVKASTLRRAGRTMPGSQDCTVLSEPNDGESMSTALRWLGIDTTRPIIGDTFHPESLPGVKVILFDFVWSAQGPKQVQRGALGSSVPPGHWALSLTQGKNYGALGIGRTISDGFKAQ
jgi:hypothetical protein